MQIYSLVYAFESYTNENILNIAYVENEEIENTLLGTFASREGALDALRHYQPIFFGFTATEEAPSELNPSILKSVIGKVADLTTGCLMVIESTLK